MQALELFATHLHAVLTQGTIKLQHKNLPLVLHSAALDGVVDMRHPSWCPLSVLLLRALASHEELIQRFRIAKRSRMECADVLLCHGHYHLASTCYSGAILRKSSVGSRGGAPATKTLWDELDRIALLKILYCAAAIKNRVEYMRAALLLRAMELQDSLDKNTASNSCTREGEFLSTSCRPYLVGHDGSDADSAFPFRFYFEVASAALVRDDHSESPTTPSSPHTARHKSPSLSSSSDSKTLQLWAGAAYKLELRLFSLFPCCVHLDEVSVLYTFDETHDTIATAGTHLYDICARSCPLESDDGRAVDATMLLSPGLSRTLTLNFTAPARSGSYSPSEARVSVISEVASIVFIGGKDQQRINGSGTFTLRATASSVLGELPHFVIVERNLSSSTLEQLSVPSMRQECFSGVDSKNPPAFVDLLDVAVLSPHLLPLPLSALAKALLGNSAQNAENPERCWREFIVQMKFGNSTQVTRYISAFHLCDPQCSLRDLSRLDTLFAATSDDTSPKDDRKLEIVFLESHLGIELEGIVSSINCVTLLPGETYCAAFNLLLGQLETESSTVSVSTGEGGIREGSVACPTLLVFLEKAGDSGPNREMLVCLSTCILRFYNAVRSGVSPTIVLPSEESFNALASNINNSAGITKAAFRARLCSRIVRRTKIQSNSMRMLTKAIRLEDASSSVIWTVLSPSNLKGLVQ